MQTRIQSRRVHHRMPVEADLEPLVFAPTGDRNPEVDDVLARIDEVLEEAQPGAE